MDPIRLIRDKDELQGTCYFEFLPGEYQDQCWNDGSVFLAEDVFGLIEPIVARHEQRFDHHGFVGIRRPVWQPIIADLQRLAERANHAASVADLAGGVGFLFATSQTGFAKRFRSNADALARMSRELAGWLREQLLEYECISVLGI